MVGCLCVPFVVVCVSVCFFARDRSTSPPGGNHVDGLPPALGRFRARSVFKREFLEICEFVWPNISCMFFSAMAFDSGGQIATRI